MSYDPKSSEEYKLLRAEILQYIQNYHNVRTFMFTATTAIFAFLLKSEPQEPFMFLLPLFIILPSYFSAVNYWLSVTVDSAYLIVFHEEEGSEFRWESRYTVFPSPKNKFYMQFVMNTQPLAYIAATAMCFIFYFMKCNNSERIISNMSGQLITGQLMSLEVIIGIVGVIICMAIFLTVKVEDKETYIEQWRMLKEQRVAS